MGLIQSLGFNVAKNTPHTQKIFKKQLFGIGFPTKKFPTTYVYLPPKVELGGSKHWHFQSIVLKKITSSTIGSPGYGFSAYLY